MKRFIPILSAIFFGTFSVSSGQVTQWDTITNLPTPRANLSMSLVNGKFYVIGGEDPIGGTPLSIVEVYDPVTGVWDTCADIPTARRGMGTNIVSVYGKIYTFGGSTHFTNEGRSTAEVYNIAKNVWDTCANMPTQRGFLATCLLDGKIYAIGGSKGNITGWADLKTVERYDPATDVWDTCADMLTGRWGLSARVLNGKIYAFGGTGSDWKGLSTMEEYDPQTDSWTTKMNMPTPRLVTASIVENNRIYVIGGAATATGPCLSNVEVYNPSTNIWTHSDEDDLPYERSGSSADTLHGKFYVFGGGRSDYSVISEVLVFDPLQTLWKQMKPMDIAKGGSASCVIDNKIYVFGGADASGTPLSTAEVYKTETNDWSDLTPMPLELWQSNTEVINNKIYMVGGWRNIDGNWSTTNSTWEYDPEGVSWTAKKDCPANTAGNASCVLNGKLYILGGLKAMPVKDTSGQRQALVYDPASDTWDSLPEMLYEHINTRASVLDNKIYVFGGYFATPTETYITGKTEMYDPEEKVWTELADMPIAVGAHISVVHENKILVFGGDTGTFTLNQSSGTNSIQEYDPSKNSWRRMQSMPFKRSVMTGQKVDNFIYLIGGLKNSRDLTHPFSEVWRFDLALLKAFISVTGISLDKDSLSLTVGSTKTLVPTVSPNVASDHSISWNSGNPAVATVADGNVTGVASGEAHIYVITKDGNFKDSCLVAVKNISQVRFGSTGDPLNGITVTWKNSGTSDSIAWGHTANLEEGVFGGFMRENKFGVTLFDYTFPPLTAGTTIHYALFDSKDSRWTEKRTFHTASDPANNRFSFTAMGDSRTIPIYWQIISEATLDTDFTLFLGNIVENGRNVEEWNDYFEYGTEFIARELVYYCYGQHDEDANPPGFDAYLSMFTLPENELFYSFNYGNAVFICLNSEDPENEAQFRWLLETLEANKDQTWKIVFFSRPFYTNHNHAGEMDGYFNTWWKVFDGYGVDMILNSLVNNYQRTKPINRSISTTSPVSDYGGIGKGRCQIVSGGAGGDLDPMADQSLWWLEKSVSKNHFCNINIDGGILTFKAMDANRNVFDEFILDKSLTGPSDFNNTNIRDSRIYPNPSDGVFYIKVPPGERYSYRIFNSVGQLISEVQNHSVTANPVLIELTNQPMGIYYFELNTDKKRLVERIILY